LYKERCVRLRDNQRKALKLRQTKSGQAAATNMKPPKYNKELRFLTPYLFDEETRMSSIPSPTHKEEASNEQTEDNDAKESSEIEYRACLEQESDTADTGAALSLSGGDISATTPSLSNVSFRVTREKLKKRHNTDNTHGSVASVFKDCLASKEERRLPEDALTNFFITMAQTVQTSPLPDQVEIKRKLFEVENSVESRIATETTARNY
jgi:hypothetical protein